MWEKNTSHRTMTRVVDFYHRKREFGRRGKRQETYGTQRAQRLQISRNTSELLHPRQREKRKL